MTLVKGVTFSLNYLREKKAGPSGEPNQGPDTGLMEPQASGRWSVKLEFVNACIAGYTSSTETTYPVTARPDLTYNGVALDIYAAKVAGPPLWEPRHTAGDYDVDGTDELAVDFGATGLWLYDNGAWTQLSGVNAESMIRADVDGDGSEEVAAGFRTLGLWLWNGGVWTQISADNPD